MDKKQVIENAKNFVMNKMKGESSGHDWWHVYRVWKTAVYIGKKEKADMFVVELAALLHDIADFKFHGGDDAVGAKISRKWLEKQGVNEEIIKHICDIVNNVSFKGIGVKSTIKTREGMAVQDADRLDAIGAIGVARGFMFAGSNGFKMHDPEIKPVSNLRAEQYKDFDRPTYTQINHFYEKLLHVKDLMNTEIGRKMAEDRHKFMQNFLDKFFKEWEGKE